MTRGATDRPHGLPASADVSRTPDPPSTVEEARAFIESAEATLLDLWIDAERASWVYSTFITDDTGRSRGRRPNERLIDETVKLSKEAQRFKGLTLPGTSRGSYGCCDLALRCVAPSDPAKSKELSQIAAEMEGIYGKGKYCPPGGGVHRHRRHQRRAGPEPRPRRAAGRLWRGWHAIAPPIRRRVRALRHARERGRARDRLSPTWAPVALRLRHAARRVREGDGPALGAGPAALRIAPLLRAPALRREVRRRGRSRPTGRSPRTCSATSGRRSGATSTTWSRPPAPIRDTT